MVQLLANALPVDLETIDANDNMLASVAATLHHLDGAAAVLHIPDEEPVCGLRWGARVRFWLGHGSQGYEVTGVVSGHSLAEAEGEAEDECAPASREILVRVWECRNMPQRRSAPRRRGRFAVHLLPLSASDCVAPPAEREWLRGWCVDIGGGGMRVRFSHPSCRPEQLALRFSLPVRGRGNAAPLRRDFDVRGCVLRATTCGRQANHMELAVKFMRLSVEEGLALSAFLCE